MTPGALDLDDPSSRSPAIPTAEPTLEQTINQLTRQVQDLQQRASQAQGVLKIDHAWPFQTITREQWSGLSLPQREHIEASIRMLMGAPPVSGGGSGTEKRHAA